MISTDGYKAFSVGDGVIIVTDAPIISESLATNPNFLHLQTIAPVSIYASSDLEKEIRCNGLPLSIKKFLKAHAIAI